MIADSWGVPQGWLEMISWWQFEWFWLNHAIWAEMNTYSSSCCATDNVIESHISAPLSSSMDESTFMVRHRLNAYQTYRRVPENKWLSACSIHLLMIVIFDWRSPLNFLSNMSKWMVNSMQLLIMTFMCDLYARLNPSCHAQGMSSQTMHSLKSDLWFGGFAFTKSLTNDAGLD